MPHSISQTPLQLALETTGQTGSIALLRGAAVVFEQRFEPSARTAAVIGPALQHVLSVIGTAGEPSPSAGQNAPADKLDFISVADGPGSFTGLRIGVTVAKMLSYARAVPLVAVDSLAAIAAVTFAEHVSVDRLLVALNAYRGQVFAGEFDSGSLLPSLQQLTDEWTAHPKTVRVADAPCWTAQLASVDAGESDASFRLCGDAKPFGPLAGYRLQNTRCDACGVGYLGLRAATLGRFIDPLSLVPRYLRASAAEENERAKGPASA